MIKYIGILLVFLLLFGSSRQALAYETQFADEAGTLRLRWKTNVIPIAFSTSMIKQSPFVRPDSDITGAIERSLKTWEKAADIKFQVSWTDKQTVSPSGKSGDGVSLVTIAQTPENLLLFGSSEQEIAAQTRVFFNYKGAITEADIILNPYEQFSTDGSVGTFDLEATLTHEIGHLLGLDHSSVIGATMHAHTGKNGVYNLPSFSSRTLAEDDLAGVRALYGAKTVSENCCGKISGKLTLNSGKSAKDFQVWAEDALSGRVAAGVLTNADGAFQIEGLTTGKYKIYAQDFNNKSTGFAVEKLSELEIVKGKTQTIAKKLNHNRKSFDLQYVGFNGQISELAVPVNGGKSYQIYVGGKNLDAETVTVGFNSPYLSVTPKSLVNHNYGNDISVISFEVRVASDIPLGEYSFFLQTKDEKSQFAVGSLTVEPFVNPWNSYLLMPNE